MSKSQIRKQASELREVLRYAIEALDGPTLDPLARIQGAKSWINGAIERCRDLEQEALKTVAEGT